MSIYLTRLISVSYQPLGVLCPFLFRGAYFVFLVIHHIHFLCEFHLCFPPAYQPGHLWRLQEKSNRARDAISSRPHSPDLPETSTANIDILKHDSGVVTDLKFILSTPHTSFQNSSALPGGETPGVEGNHPSSSQRETNASEKIKKAWGVTQSGLLTALRLLEKSADAFPPIKSAVGGLVACLTSELRLWIRHCSKCLIHITGSRRES